MATYLELHEFRAAPLSDALKQKITVAIAVKANGIAKLPAPTERQREWAVEALATPSAFTPLLLNYILAEYRSQTTGAIANASDAQVQSAVDAAVDTLLGV